MAWSKEDLRLLDGGFGLSDLLIQLRRFEGRQYLPGCHVAAYVDIPVLQIAAGARVNGRVREGLDVSGEHHFRSSTAALASDG